MKLHRWAALCAAMCVTTAAQAKPHELPMANPHGVFIPPAVGTVNAIPYNGGSILANMDIVSVQWTTNIGGTTVAPDPAQMAYENGLYAAMQTFPISQLGGMEDGPFLHFLRQYNTPMQQFTSIKYSGTYTIYPILPASHLTTLSDNPNFTDYSKWSISQELVVQMANGHLPWPHTGSLYVVHFPPGVTVQDESGSSTCVGVCAYHDWATHGGTVGSGVDPRTQIPFAYSVVPDMLHGGCAPPAAGCGSTNEEVFGMPTSHEIAEAATDPDGNGWVDANQYGEIGDPCNWAKGGEAAVTYLDNQPLTSSRYVVQWEWSNRAKACVDVEQDHLCCGFDVAQPVCWMAAPGVECSRQHTLGNGAYSIDLQVLPEAPTPTFSPTGINCTTQGYNIGITSPAAGPQFPAGNGSCITSWTGTYAASFTPGLPFYSKVCVPPLQGPQRPPLATCRAKTSLERMRGRCSAGYIEPTAGVCCQDLGGYVEPGTNNWCTNDIPNLFK